MAPTQSSEGEHPGNQPPPRTTIIVDHFDKEPYNATSRITIKHGKRTVISNKSEGLMFMKNSNENHQAKDPVLIVTKLKKRKFGDRSGIKMWAFDHEVNMWVVKRNSRVLEYYQSIHDFNSWTKVDLAKLSRAPFHNPSQDPCGNPTIFSICLHYGGEFTKFPRRKYIKGQHKFVDLIDNDLFSVHDIDDMMGDLGCIEEGKVMYYCFKQLLGDLDFVLFALHSDQDANHLRIQEIVEPPSYSRSLCLEWIDTTTPEPPVLQPSMQTPTMEPNMKSPSHIDVAHVSLLEWNPLLKLNL
ncbi:unnamed protein product [Lactuca saligna]|uniref:PB1-like domain-containing protein n=1 Tax=Lactuca saligna TaxID=75948 RepID=A0AA36E3Y5_LACSI|nr:unnamed protein product [Lactuca saligna]